MWEVLGAHFNTVSEREGRREGGREGMYRTCIQWNRSLYQDTSELRTPL